MLPKCRRVNHENVVRIVYKISTVQQWSIVFCCTLYRCCVYVYRLVVRILPPVTDKCIVPLGMKFGCHPKQVPHLLKVAKELDLDVVGVR